MGRLDVETRKYMSKPEVLADAFNYFLYEGKQIVKPEELQDVDSAELAVVYGSGARVPVQKFRDTLKRWTVKRDKNAVYMLLGAESQICSPHKGREPRGFERFKSLLCELTLPRELRHGGEEYAL